MTRLTRTPLAVVGVAVAIALLATPASARMGPSLLMIYGGSLRAPVFISIETVRDLGTYGNFWGAFSHRVEPSQYADRPYFNVAMFWGSEPLKVDRKDLKPENAPQHGRLYVATDKLRAAMVSSPYMRLDSDGRMPLPRPVPRDVGEFYYGEWLTEVDLEIADKLGLPLRANKMDGSAKYQRILSAQ